MASIEVVHPYLDAWAQTTHDVLAEGYLVVRDAVERVTFHG